MVVVVISQPARKVSQLHKKTPINCIFFQAGKDPDKLLKRKMRRKLKASNSQSNGSALEAIEKIVQEKKISTKINYDVLRSLNNSSLIKSDNDASNVSITVG